MSTVGSRFMIILSFLIVGCSDKELSMQELSEYLRDEENGVTKTVEDSDLSISLTFKPGEAVAIHEINSYTTEEERDSIAAHYRRYLYFQLSFSKGNEDLNLLSSTDPSGKISRYLNQEIGSHIEMLADDKEVKLLDHIYTNVFGGTGKSDILLVFENDIQNSETIQVKLNTGPLGLGDVHFEFKTNDILSVPKLNYSNR